MLHYAKQIMIDRDKLVYEQAAKNSFPNDLPSEIVTHVNCLRLPGCRMSHSHLQLSAVTCFFPLSHFDLLRSDIQVLKLSPLDFAHRCLTFLVTAVKPMHIAS